MTPENSLTRVEQPGLPATSMTPAQMMERMVDRGVTAENVQAFTELVKLSEHVEDRNAKREFNIAFAQLQSKKPVIIATSVIKNRGKYAKFEDVMAAVQPILDANGFTVSFDQDFKDNRILVTCHLLHVGGHERANTFAVRSGPADSDTQADCKASTTAKRNALLQALNIVIRQDVLNDDEDAAIEGDPNAKVTKSQAEELERRAQLLNCAPAFLSYAKSETFADIPANRYADLDQMLSRKEKQRH